MWSLYEKEEFLKPLVFSNGKSQEDVVGEILAEIKKGTKIIFVHGMCGTGKSAIALHLAKEIGKTSIVVPGKNLQHQYKKDYEGMKQILKKDKSPLSISIISGRNNHRCAFISDGSLPEREKRESNSSLFGNYTSTISTKKYSPYADHPDIPCTIEIKERNADLIKKFLHATGGRKFTQLSELSRLPIAKACPYWSPIIPEEVAIKDLSYALKRTYEGLSGKKFTLYQRKRGCSYYEQFHAYLDSDVIVFNAAKYRIESALGRKPKTELEIIDECDEFLDSFSEQRTINMDRLFTATQYLFSPDPESATLKQKLIKLLEEIKQDTQTHALIKSKEIQQVAKTPLQSLFDFFIEHHTFFETIDEESYVADVNETVTLFEPFLDETYLTIEQKERGLSIQLVAANLARGFQEIIDKNKTLVLMSGTIHTEEVLKNIFKIKEYVKISAETKQPGNVSIMRTGKEFDCKYSSFEKGKDVREKYLQALNESVARAPRPTIVQVQSFSDLPTREEREALKLLNLLAREDLISMQEEDKEGQQVMRFKQKEIDLLFSTRCTRGIDFPGDECRGIVFTKYPNPPIQDPFWKILAKTKPEFYWAFYRDRARRELLQRLYRGIRFKEDYVTVLSPDLRVLGALGERF